MSEALNLLGMASEYQCEWLRWRCLLAIKTCTCTLPTWVMYEHAVDRLLDIYSASGFNKRPYPLCMPAAAAVPSFSDADILETLSGTNVHGTGVYMETLSGTVIYVDRSFYDDHTAWKDSLAADYTDFGIVEPSEAGGPRLYKLRRALFYDMDEYKALSPHVQRDLTGARERAAGVTLPLPPPCLRPASALDPPLTTARTLPGPRPEPCPAPDPCPDPALPLLWQR